MEPGVLRLPDEVTTIELATLEPQLLFAVTSILPDVLPNVTVIDVVNCPAVIVDPEGTVHV
jgi:hypothetical protein